MKLANYGRDTLGAAYLAGALFNGTITLTMSIRNPQFYTQWAASPVIPFYKTFFKDVVTPHAPLVTVLVVLYELTIGVLILRKGIAVKLGLIGGILFNMLLAPMWIGQTFFNLILAALHAPLLRHDFEEPLIFRRVSYQARHDPLLDS